MKVPQITPFEEMEGTISKIAEKVARMRAIMAGLPPDPPEDQPIVDREQGAADDE